MVIKKQYIYLNHSQVSRIEVSAGASKLSRSQKIHIMLITYVYQKAHFIDNMVIKSYIYLYIC